MKRQIFLIPTAMCALLFSYGSGASTHLYSLSAPEERAFTPASYQGINFEPGIAATQHTAKLNGSTELAVPASGFQRQLGGGFSDKRVGSSLNRTRLLRASPRQHDIAAMPLQNSERSLADSSTLILIGLGFTALGLSRRRIKLAALASTEPDHLHETYPMNSGAAAVFDVNSSQFQFLAANTQATNTTPTDTFDEDKRNTSEPVQTAEEDEPGRNPYPELALSVQKLEALAHEMEHFC